MKKSQFIALILSFCILLCVSACGTTVEPKVSESAEPADSNTATAQEAESGEEDVIVDADDLTNPYGLSDDTFAMIAKSQEIHKRQVEAGFLPGPEKNYDEEGHEVSIRGVSYTYPLLGEHSVSIWAVFNGNLTNWLDSYADLRAWTYVQECTNINLEFVSVGEDVATTQYSLMLASGDYPNIINGFGSNMTDSSLSTATAYDQGIIICLDDYLESYMPNYYAWINFNEAYQREVKDDEGRIFGVYTVNTEDVTEAGNWVRSDLLDKFGIDKPVTVDEYEEYFSLCKGDGMEQVIGFNKETLTTYFSSAFDIAGLDGAALYVENSTVKSSYDSSAAYDYVSTLISWNEQGFIDRDVMSISGAPNDSIYTEAIYSGNLGIFQGMSGHYSDMLENAKVEGFDILAVADMVQNEGDITHFDEQVFIKTDSCAVVTATCEDVEAACRLLDWFYTDEGINTGNYGAEGVTWYWDSDGNRQFTELIWNDTEFNLIPSNVFGIYCLQGRFNFVADPWLNIVFQTPVVLDAMNTWSGDGDTSYYLNTNTLSLTQAEEDAVISHLSDLSTFAQEQLNKVILGELEFSEEWWNSFVSSLKDMGLDSIVEQYQTAYKRYCER